MAIRVEQLKLESGGSVLIEAFDVEGAVERVGITDKAARTFEAAWSTVLPVIQSLSKKMADCGPTETQIKFGIKVGTDLNAIITSAKGEANFEISLSWKPSS